MAVDKREKVTIRIPKTSVGDGQKVVTAYINGKPYTIEVGVDVEVPTDIKEILDNGGYLG